MMANAFVESVKNWKPGCQAVNNWWVRETALMLRCKVWRSVRQFCRDDDEQPFGRFWSVMKNAWTFKKDSPLAFWNCLNCTVLHVLYVLLYCTVVGLSGSLNEFWPIWPGQPNTINWTQHNTSSTGTVTLLWCRVHCMNRTVLYRDSPRTVFKFPSKTMYQCASMNWQPHVQIQYIWHRQMGRI